MKFVSLWLFCFSKLLDFFVLYYFRNLRIRINMLINFIMSRQFIILRLKLEVLSCVVVMVSVGAVVT